MREFGKMLSRILCMAFSPDGKILAAADQQEGVIHFWDPATGKGIRHINACKEPVHALTYAPRGNLLASAGGDGADVAKCHRGANLVPHGIK